jgi:hypothetical protein
VSKLADPVEIAMVCGLARPRAGNAVAYAACPGGTTAVPRNGGSHALVVTKLEVRLGCEQRGGAATSWQCNGERSAG